MNLDVHRGLFRIWLATTLCFAALVFIADKPPSGIVSDLTSPGQTASTGEGANSLNFKPIPEHVGPGPHNYYVQNEDGSVSIESFDGEPLTGAQARSWWQFSPENTMPEALMGWGWVISRRLAIIGVPSTVLTLFMWAVAGFFPRQLSNTKLFCAKCGSDRSS